VLTSPFTSFQIKIQHELYPSNTCAFTEIVQCHVYKPVPFPTASLLAFCSLTSPPARMPAAELTLAACSGTISVFSRDDITTVPVSQLLLWDVFHILAVPSRIIILETTFTELQGKNATLSLNTERKKILKMFPEKRANVSVCSKDSQNEITYQGHIKAYITHLLLKPSRAELFKRPLSCNC